MGKNNDGYPSTYEGCLFNLIPRRPKERNRSWYGDGVWRGTREESKRLLRKPVKGWGNKKKGFKRVKHHKIRNSEEIGVQYTAKFQQHEILNTVKVMKSNMQ